MRARRQKKFFRPKLVCECFNAVACRRKPGEGKKKQKIKGRALGAKCEKHEDAGRKASGGAVGDQQRGGLTWLCQTSVITKHSKLHTLI